MGEEHVVAVNADFRERLEAFQRTRGGRLYAKVRLCGPDVDGWPASTAALYLDGVHFADHPDGGVVAWSDASDDFEVDLTSRSPTLVVVRGYADRTIFGLLIAGQELLGRRCAEIDAIRMAAITRANGHDANMDWVYHRRNIEVVEEAALGLEVMT
jgi:hypothetical protein